MKTGLFFGSFNPIHIGHMAIANYMVEFTDIDQVWFVVSPHNPLKRKKTLLQDYDRLELVIRAINDDPKFQASDIEFKMPRPSYTIDTLTYLSEKHPRQEFVLIIGSDQLPTFHSWKNFELILENYHRYIYPRPGFDNIDLPYMEKATLVHAPLIDISSSFIRQAIKEGKDVKYFLPRKVWEYIQEMNFYS